MTKLETIALNHFKYSLEPIDYNFNLLTKKEKEIFENQETLNVIRREVEVLSSKQ
jgi:hypothetical protein